jgi:hypothetical protein
LLESEPLSLNSGIAARWRRRFEDWSIVVQRARDMPPEQAKTDAFQHIVIEYLNETHPDTDPRVCALPRAGSAADADSAVRGRRAACVASSALPRPVGRSPTQGRHRDARGYWDPSVMIRFVRKIPDSERWKRRRRAKPQASSAPASPPADRARIDKWIRDRLIEWRDSCLRCRKPIVPGQKWIPVSNGEVTTHFHRECHDSWLAEQEALARQTLGLDRSERE